MITEQRCFSRKRRKRSSSYGSEGEQAGAKSGEAHEETMELVTKSVVSGIVTRK